MSNVTARGTKRVCQSETCALPFYDLNRTDFACPTCGTVFDMAVVLHARKAPAATSSWKRNSRAYPIVAEAPAAEPKELEDAVVETDSDDADDNDASALILEEEDDGDVGDVVKAPADDRGDV